METPSKIPKPTIKGVLLTLLGFFTWFIILAFLILSVPAYLYRFFITKCVAPCWSRFHNPDLRDAVSVYGNGCAVEFWGNNGKGICQSTRCAIVSTIIVEGTIPLEELENAVRERWLNAVDDHGKLLYPEFQQYIESWMGFMFWKKCKNFRMADYLKLHIIPENSVAGDGPSVIFLDELVEKLLNQPFPHGKSPWEIHLVQNYRDTNFSQETINQTTFVLRVHHGMADGYSLLHAVVGELLQKDYPQLNNPVSKLKGKILSFSRLAECLLYSLRLSYDLGFMTSHYFRAKTPWHVQDSEKSWHQLYEKSKRIPISRIKAIKNKFGVSFSSVLFSSVAAGLAETIRSYNIKLEKIPTVTFLPLPGHSRRLRNHFTGTIFDLPINPSLSPSTRLMCCETNLQQSKNSMIPYIIRSVVAPLFLSHCAPIAKLVSHNRIFPFGISSVPFSKLGNIDWNKRRLLSIDVVVGGTLGDAGIGFMVVSFENYIRITATGEKAVVSRDELKQMIRWVEEEIQELDMNINS